MFRIIEIADRSFSLSLSNNNLCAEKEDRALTSVPLDEISAVLITEPSITLTGVLLSELGRRQIPLVCCNKNYLPAALLTGVTFAGKKNLPLLQYKLTKFAKAKIWQRLIRSKIAGQNLILQKWRNNCALARYPDLVVSGDKNGMEAQASAIYWRSLAVFDHRNHCANDANILFNYGYAILYAAFAREIVLAGLLPDLGIWHHHRDNDYNLASDLMEPLRPCIDNIILQILSQTPVRENLSKSTKENFFKQLYSMRLKYDSSWHTLFSFIRITVRSFVSYLHTPELSCLVFPCWEEEDYVDFGNF